MHLDTVTHLLQTVINVFLIATIWMQYLSIRNLHRRLNAFANLLDLMRVNQLTTWKLVSGTYGRRAVVFAESD